MPASKSVSIGHQVDHLGMNSQPIPLGCGLKRGFDVIFSLVALTSFLLPLIVIAVAIRLITGESAFYVHWRVGYKGRPIPCLKFQTMVPDADRRLKELLATDTALREEFEATRKLRRDPRIIPGIGHFLRRSSLDELPQFLNVVAGHMSVVGPRPVTLEEIALYGDSAEKYFATRPGITGLWQVSGRSEATFEQRVDLDCHYVDHWTIWLDLRIIAKTVLVLGKGA